MSSCIDHAQSSESDGCQHQSKIPKRDIKIARYEKEIDNDQSQPRGYDVREDLWFEKHADTGRDLYCADQVHESGTSPAEHIIDNRRQVLLPVDQQAKVFVYARYNRRRRKAEPKDLIRLISLI